MNSEKIYQLFLSKFRDQYNATFFQAIENSNAKTRLKEHDNPNTVFDQQVKKAVIARIDQEIKNAAGRSAGEIANTLINDMAPFIKGRNEQLENRDKAETNKFGLTTSNATFDVARHKKGNQDNNAAMVSDVQSQASAFVNTILPAKDFGSQTNNIVDPADGRKDVGSTTTRRASDTTEGSVTAESDLAMLRDKKAAKEASDDRENRIRSF